MQVDVVVGSGGRWKVRMRQRPSEGLLGGMWEFPASEVTEAPDESGARPALEPVRHVFSHFRAEYRPWLSIIAAEDAAMEGHWIDEAGIDALALPVAQQKIAAQLRDRMRSTLGLPSSVDLR